MSGIKTQKGKIMEKISRESYDRIVKIIEKHITPMYFNTGLPIMCIVNSEVRKLEKETETVSALHMNYEKKKSNII